jgi:hypothetical protein
MFAHVMGARGYVTATRPLALATYHGMCPLIQITTWDVMGVKHNRIKKGQRANKGGKICSNILVLITLTSMGKPNIRV